MPEQFLCETLDAVSKMGFLRQEVPQSVSQNLNSRYEPHPHQEQLLEGKIVDLGDFGTFRLGVKAEGSDTAEEVTPDNIKSLNGRFTPGKEFKEAIKRATFEKMLIS